MRATTKALDVGVVRVANAPQNEPLDIEKPNDETDVSTAKFCCVSDDRGMIASLPEPTISISLSEISLALSAWKSISSLSVLSIAVGKILLNSTDVRLEKSV